METVEIRCPKSMLNVAKRAKKGKNRYISSFRACSGRRGRRFKSCHPDQIGMDFASFRFFSKKNEDCINPRSATAHYSFLFKKSVFFITAFRAHTIFIQCNTAQRTTLHIQARFKFLRSRINTACKG